jgi:signal peptidase I
MVVKIQIKKIAKKITQLFALLVVIIGLTIIMKAFLFASFKIPTPSMEPAIMAGDHILVNKLILGPRLYENRKFLQGKKTKMKRIRGLRKVKRNDVLVFDFPYKPDTPDKIRQGGSLFYVKRCVAIPGDTFYIDNGIYKVKGIHHDLGHVERQRKLSEKEEASFREELRQVFPKDTAHYQWTIKNFGPLYVPAKGDYLEIDSVSIILYKNLIEYETEKDIFVKNGTIFLADSAISHYTFRQDYYFVAGDWIFDSIDSRYWGLLPDDLIIGKATIVWKSEDLKNKKYRWNRFFKTIK